MLPRATFPLETRTLTHHPAMPLSPPPIMAAVPRLEALKSTIAFSAYTNMVEADDGFSQMVGALLRLQRVNSTEVWSVGQTNRPPALGHCG